MLLVAAHGWLVHRDLVCREMVDEMGMHDSGSVAWRVSRCGGQPRARLGALSTPHLPEQDKQAPYQAPSLRYLTAPRDSLMGIRMDDLHTPTVASGPTSGGYSNGVPKEQLSLQELIAEKDRLEAELKALGQVLDSVSGFDDYAELELMVVIAWCAHEHWPHHIRRLPAQ
jgi:hypothetical protein